MLARNLIALVVTVGLLARGAHACECPDTPLEDATVQTARNVFIFQLVSAEATTHDVREHSIQARIRVVESIKGAPNFAKMRYLVSDCCGTHLDVGRYYVAFVSVNGVEFDGYPGNLMAFGETYAPNSEISKKLQAVVAKKQTLEQAFGDYPGRLEIVGPPSPPPCNGK